MKQFNMKFSDLKEDTHFRLDVKFYKFYNENKWNIFNSRSQDLIKLKDVLKRNEKIFEYEEDEEYFGIPTGSSYIDEFGDIIDKQIVTKEEHPGRLKYKINAESILISSLRLARAPVVSYKNIDFGQYVFSNGFYILKVKNNWKKEFVISLLNLPQIKNIIDNNIYRGIGISSYKVEDLLKLEIPNISIEKQNLFIEKAKKIEQEIKKYKAKIKNHIIDDVFSNYFNYDKNIIYQVHKGMTFGTQKDGNTNKNVSYIDFSDIGDKNYRLSTRVNNSISTKLYNKILCKSHMKISNITLELVKGVQPTYSEEGIKVIKIANLKNSKIDFENTEYASKAYCSNLPENKFLRKNDIIICCTGKGSLGKVDIVECEEEAITAVDNYILRIDTNRYNPKFLTYFLRSVLGVIQFEMNYTGMTNQIHFYDVNIANILIPDISLKSQYDIVREVENEMKEQEKIRCIMREKRNEVSRVLEEMIKGDCISNLIDFKEKEWEDELKK